MTLKDAIEWFRAHLERPDNMDDVDWESTLTTVAQHAVDHGLVLNQPAPEKVVPEKDAK